MAKLAHEIAVFCLVVASSRAVSRSVNRPERPVGNCSPSALPVLQDVLVLATPVAGWVDVLGNCLAGCRKAHRDRLLEVIRGFFHVSTKLGCIEQAWVVREVIAHYRVKKG